MDGDTLNSHELSDSLENQSGSINQKGEYARAKSPPHDEMRCSEGTEEGQPHRPELTQTEDVARDEARKHDEAQHPSPRSSIASPPRPPIPKRKPFRCRICGASYYAQGQTRGLCYICANTLSL